VRCRGGKACESARDVLCATEGVSRRDSSLRVASLLVKLPDDLQQVGERLQQGGHGRDAYVCHLGQLTLPLCFPSWPPDAVLHVYISSSPWPPVHVNNPALHVPSPAHLPATVLADSSST
jgi:hypothetical protein